MLDPAEGYEVALCILREQFGDVNAVAEEYLSVLIEVPVIKSQDGKGLSTLAAKMHACEVTLKQLGCGHRLQSERTLGSIVSRFPTLMQS